MSRADVIVAGLGATGSAAAWQLARRGLRVLGFDRYHPPHPLGSSHGGSRVIREMAFEHPRYVPLVRRAYDLWNDVEGESRGAHLLLRTGALYLGVPTASVVSGSRASAVAHGVPSEELTADAVRRRWPPFSPDEGMVGLFERRAGVLRPEACVGAFLEAAARHRAELRYDEPVVAWDAEPAGGVRVRTPGGTHDADHLVLATGPWMQEVLGELGAPVVVERVVQHWFAPARDGEGLEPSRFPVYLCEDADGVIFYGFPLLEGALKAAVHHRGEATSAETVRRDVTPAEVARTRYLLARWVPPAAGAHLRSAACVYTNTSDGDFIIDRHPEHAQVVLASPCSGIGFKFAPAVGEILADLVTGAPPRFDLSPFSLRRFARR